MPRVAALYRYPVKGFTPEASDTLTVLADGRVAGDRALAFRFADSPLPEEAWSKKYDFAVLVNTPGLARLKLSFDPRTQRLSIECDGHPLVEDTIDPAGRVRIAEAIERFVLSLPDNPLGAHPERRPLRLVGDGVTPRYQDSSQGQITLHARESIDSLARALRRDDLDEARFRSNIVVEGIAEWEEQDWIGRTIRIGSVQFEVLRPKVRCLATHANPRTGERDLPVMQTLVRAFQQQEPTFAVALTTAGRGGELHVGDTITVL